MRPKKVLRLTKKHRNAFSHVFVLCFTVYSCFLDEKREFRELVAFSGVVSAGRLVPVTEVMSPDNMGSTFGNPILVSCHFSIFSCFSDQRGVFMYFF